MRHCLPVVPAGAGGCGGGPSIRTRERRIDHCRGVREPRAGRGWCTRRRRARWWPGAARACRGRRRRRASPPRTAPGTRAATCATGQWCWQSWTPGRPGARADLADLRGVAAGGQHPRQRGHPVLRRRARRDALGRPEQLDGAVLGEGADGRLAAVLGEEAQRGDGQVVVAVPEPGPARVGEQVLPRRASAAAGPACATASRTSASPASSSASRCRRTAGAVSAERGRDRGGGAGALLHEQPGDRPPGAALGVHAVGRDPGVRGPVRGGPAAFHNTSVTYIRVIGKTALRFGVSG